MAQGLGDPMIFYTFGKELLRIIVKRARRDIAAP